MKKKEGGKTTPRAVLIVSIIFFILIGISFISQILLLLGMGDATNLILPKWYTMIRFIILIIEVLLLVYILRMSKLALNLFTLVVLFGEHLLAFLVELRINSDLLWPNIIGLIISLILLSLFYTKYKFMK